jgi:hypothetical protein
MKVAANQALDISQTLESAMQYGARYVCLDAGVHNEVFRPQTMHFFGNKTDAEQHAYIKRVNENDYLTAMPVKALHQQLDRSIELQQVSGLPDGKLKDVVIDVSRILSEERIRQEIFIREIFYDLYDKKIQPDMRRLVECVQNDETKFTIDGVHRERGVETPRTIYIEQNDSRAFVITGIQQQINYQGKNQESMKSEVLEGSVRVKDAREIKDLLEVEKDNGSRFVSFPSGKDGLKEQDFTPFKSAIDAYQHANVNTNESEKYIVRSITVVEKEIDRVVENRKEQTQENLPEKEVESKRSKNREMER